MYIRKVAHTDNKNRQEYYTFKLVESLRTERGPRQRTLLNLGHEFNLSEEKWKDLANRIEEIVTGQTPLFDSDPEIENLAIRYARKIVGDYRRSFAGSRSYDTEAPDYQRVDVCSVDNEQGQDCRCGTCCL